MDNSYLDLEPGDASPMDAVLGHAITYRIAVGPNAGRTPRALPRSAITSGPSMLAMTRTWPSHVKSASTGTLSPTKKPACETV